MTRYHWPHLVRVCSPARWCGRFIRRLIFLCFAAFVLLNILYMFPLSIETNGFLVARSAAELDDVKEVRLPRAALGIQVLQEAAALKTSLKTMPKTTLKPMSKTTLKTKLAPKRDTDQSLRSTIPPPVAPAQKKKSVSKPGAKRKIVDRCALYKWSSKINRTVEINVLHSRTLPSEERAVTMVTQLDASRIPRLVDMAKLWKWPMSVSVYVRVEVIDKYRQMLRKVFANRTNIAIHLIINTKTYYPVNNLRNIALKNANTTYVFLNDVDFIPMPNIEQKLTKHLDQARAQLTNKTLFVIAAFEHINSGLKMPDTKEELINMWMVNRTVRPVHFTTVNGTFVPNHGQGATNYNLWKTSIKPYKIKFHMYYEPYIIMETAKVVRYDNSFVGRYFDKSSQVMELHAQGFHFIGLHDVYTVHAWHTNSPFYRAIYKCAFANHENFKRYIRERYQIKI